MKACTSTVPASLDGHDTVALKRRIDKYSQVPTPGTSQNKKGKRKGEDLETAAANTVQIENAANGTSNECPEL